MTQAEREHRRYAHEAAITFCVGARVIAGRTQNVSRGGLCASLADPVPMGTELDVDMVLVFEDDAQSDALRLPARVIWCTAVDNAHQVGLVFRSLDAERAEYLRLFLRYLDDGAQREKTPRESEIDKRFG